MSQTRRLAAILAADVAGYLWLMGRTKRVRSNASKRGFLGSASPRGGAASSPSVTVLCQGLRETGYIEEQNLAIEYGRAVGLNPKVSQLAAPDACAASP
jgi:hypothetical protein